MLTVVIFEIICYYSLFLYSRFQTLQITKMISIISFEINIPLIFKPVLPNKNTMQTTCN